MNFELNFSLFIAVSHVTIHVRAAWPFKRFSLDRDSPVLLTPTKDVTTKQEMNGSTEEHGPNAEKTNEDASELDLNSSTWESCSSGQRIVKDGLREETDKDGLTIGLTNGKVETRKVEAI